MRSRFFALIAATLIAVAGCSGATPVTGESSTVSTDAPTTTPRGGTAPTLHPLDTTVAPATTESSKLLPGLSEECSQAITAQSSVNKLFALALTEQEPAKETTAESTDGDDASVDAGSVSNALTEDDIVSTFEEIGEQIPEALGEQFTTLHAALESAVQKPPSAIPDLLAEPDVASALDDLAEFIDDCSPAVANQ